MAREGETSGKQAGLPGWYCGGCPFRNKFFWVAKLIEWSWLTETFQKQLSGILECHLAQFFFFFWLFSNIIFCLSSESNTEMIPRLDVPSKLYSSEQVFGMGVWSIGQKREHLKWLAYFCLSSTKGIIGSQGLCLPGIYYLWSHGICSAIWLLLNFTELWG